MSAGAEKAVIVWAKGKVSALWDHPAKGKTYLVLGHGAGGTMHTPMLASFAAGLAARGVGVLRFNFPYAEIQRKTPNPQPVLEACYRTVVEYATWRAPRLFLGGRSMGGRIASHIVAGGVPANGLVFVSYPLHPPGKPAHTRDAHLYSIEAPMLFLQGTHDTFARPKILAATLKKLPRATLHTVEGGDHSIFVRGRPTADVIRELVETTVSWIEAVSSS